MALRAVLAAAGGLLLATRPVAAPLPADALEPALLKDCDARAAAFGAYEQPIAGAARDLIAMDVFQERDFHSVRIGFCGLRDAGGPEATANCAEDTILIDNGLAANARALPLVTTLAHEMLHDQQHKERKAVFGAAYCNSERYAAEKPTLEEAADAFGDAVATLFFVGRAVEIVNDCPVGVAVYLEADDPIYAVGVEEIIEVRAKSRAAAPVKSASKFFKFYARSQPLGDTRWVWHWSDTRDLRFIGGKPYALRRATLAAPLRATGPFRLRLSCPPQQP